MNYPPISSLFRHRGKHLCINDTTGLRSCDWIRWYPVCYRNYAVFSTKIYAEIPNNNFKWIVSLSCEVFLCCLDVLRAFCNFKCCMCSSSERWSVWCHFSLLIIFSCSSGLFWRPSAAKREPLFTFLLHDHYHFATRQVAHRAETRSLHFLWSLRA